MCLTIIKIRNQEEGVFYFILIYSASCSSVSRHWLSFLKVGLLYAYVLWGFCCAFSLKISAWAALEGLQGIHFKRHLSATKHYFSQVLLLLSKFCEFLFGGESPTFWSCHAPYSPPFSGSTPKPSSLCFWGIVELVGELQLSGAGVTALESATQWGVIIWTALFSYIVFFYTV